MIFSFLRKKSKKSPSISNEDLKKISQVDITILQEAAETISLAEDVVRSLKSKLDDYVVQIQKISSMINDAVIMTNVNGIIESVNTSAANIFGYSDKELIGIPFSVLLSESITDMSYLDNIAIKCEHEIQYYKECMGIKKDKDSIHIELSVSKIHKANKSIYYIIIIKDVTSRVTGQIQLRESEQYFRAFGEASTEAIMLHNDEKILKYNDRLIDLSSYTKEEIEEINPYSLFQEKDLPLIYTTEYNTDAVISTYVKNKEGDYIPISLSNKNVDWNEESAKIKVMNDITIYRHAEDILRNSNERYKSVIDNNIDIVCCYDTDLKITFVNQTFLDYYGIEKDEAIGHFIYKFFLKEDYDLLRKNMDTISITNPVKRSLYKVSYGSEYRWQDWIDRGIFDNESNLIEIQAVSRDITAYINIK